jgi:glycerophosphoryl diester phosphodiesterase
MDRFINYAHRGASAYAPGNTLSAFYLGLACGANGIETDVRASRDGVLMLFHDKTLESVGKSGPVSDYDYAELCELTVTDERCKIKSDRLVSFEDFLRRFGYRDIYFAIEIKQEGIERETLALIRKYGVEKKTVVTSFSFSILERVKAAAPDIPVGYLIRDLTDDAVCRLLSIEGEQLCPHASALDAAAVARLKEKGLSVRAWGVKDEETMRKMYDIGTDGMTVNFPDKLAEYIASKGR